MTYEGVLFEDQNQMSLQTSWALLLLTEQNYTCLWALLCFSSAFQLTQSHVASLPDSLSTHVRSIGAHLSMWENGEAGLVEIPLVGYLMTQIKTVKYDWKMQALELIFFYYVCI